MRGVLSGKLGGSEFYNICICISADNTTIKIGRFADEKVV